MSLLLLYSGVPALVTLTWGSGGSVNENAANGTVAGTVAGRTSGSTLTLSDDAGGRFAINSGTGQVTVANTTLINYEDNTSHNIDVVETLAGTPGSPKTTTLSVTVNNINAPAATEWGPNTGTTGWKTASSVVSDGSGDAAWSNPTASAVGTDDTTYSQIVLTSGLVSDVLELRGFGFTTSDVPSDSTINGVEVELIARRGTDPGFFAVVLADTDSIGDLKNPALSGAANTDITEILGSSSDLWGATLDDAIIRDANFGIDFTDSSFLGTASVSIDRVRMRVTYAGAAGDPTIASTASIGTAVRNLNKSSTTSLTIVGGTGSSMFELYDNGGTWAIRTSASLTTGSKTLQIRDTTVGPSGSGEDRTDTITVVVTGGGGTYLHKGTQTRAQGYKGVKSPDSQFYKGTLTGVFSS